MIKKKKKKRSLKKFVFLGLFFCLAGAVAYFLVWSPFFWVEEIRVEAVGDGEPMYYSSAEIEKIAKGVLRNKLFYFIPQRSVFLAPMEEIEEKILEKFPEIRLVDVFKKIPSVLAIKIEERRGVGVWCSYQSVVMSGDEEGSGLRIKSAMTGEDDEIATLSGVARNDGNIEREIGDCFKIDRDGVIFRESPLIGGNLVLNIYSENGSAKIGDEIIPPKVMDFILAAEKELSKIKTDRNVFPAAGGFEFVSDEELRATTLQGWQIYFNPSIAVISQIDALKTILNNETERGLSALEYVDLRIEGRIYYK